MAAKFAVGLCAGVAIMALAGCGDEGMRSGASQVHATVTKMGPIECPFGYTNTPVGREGGFLCLNPNNAFGPFTKKMAEKCRAAGGGNACSDEVIWNKAMALSTRGTGLCPVGATFDPSLTYCVEGIDAFGPFPVRFVTECIRLGGGQVACRSARWDKAMLKRVLAAVR